MEYDDNVEFYLKNAYDWFKKAEEDDNLHNKIQHLTHGLQSLCYHIHETEKELRERGILKESE